MKNLLLTAGLLSLANTATAQTPVKCGRAYIAAKAGPTTTTLQACVTRCAAVDGRAGDFAWCQAEQGRRAKAAARRKKARTAKRDLAARGFRVRGFLPKGEITKAIGARSESIRACYDKLLQTRNVRGLVKVRFTIGLQGRVVRSSVAETAIKDTDFERCLLGEINQLVVPRPDGGIVQVVYPFNFRPE